MAILAKTIRSVGVALAVLFAALSLLGIAGVWWVDHAASDFARKVFGVIETATGVVEAGVARADDLMTRSRVEVRQTSETITSVGTRPPANRPVLNALQERLETSLSPRITQTQQLLTPVRDAVARISDLLSLLNSLPMTADRAPRLEALDQAFNRLEGLSADATQLRGTLRELVAEQRDDLTPETIATLTRLTERIDTRLGEVQASVQELRKDVATLQVRLDTRKRRVLLLFNVLALLSTLMLAWVVYSQCVVIRHFRR